MNEDGSRSLASLAQSKPPSSARSGDATCRPSFRNSGKCASLLRHKVDPVGQTEKETWHETQIMSFLGNDRNPPTPQGTFGELEVVLLF